MAWRRAHRSHAEAVVASRRPAARLLVRNPMSTEIVGRRSALGSPSSESLLALQALAGNQAVTRLVARGSDAPPGEPAPGLIRRTLESAEQYGPNPDLSLGHLFRSNHTCGLRAFTDQTAIGNHEMRALATAPNTTMNFTKIDAQYEIMVYLEALSQAQHEALVDQPEIFFTSAGAYDFIVTEWNDGDPRVLRRGRGNVQLGMQWVEAGGYYRIHHFGPP